MRGQGVTLAVTTRVWISVGLDQKHPVVLPVPVHSGLQTRTNLQDSRTSCTSTRQSLVPIRFPQATVNVAKLCVCVFNSSPINTIKLSLRLIALAAVFFHGASCVYCVISPSWQCCSKPWTMDLLWLKEPPLLSFLLNCTLLPSVPAKYLWLFNSYRCTEGGAAKRPRSPVWQ